MASTSEISALSVRLLLLALLSLTPTGADVDRVTWVRCTHASELARVLDSSRDNYATWLSAEVCNITEIRRGDFDGLPNLDTISLSYNKIVHVDWAAFTPVRTLKELYLRDNELRKLPVPDEPSLFPRLTVLSLSSNQLTGIPHAKTFSTCPQLKRLYLHSNQLEHLHPHVFWPLAQLEDLFLDNNKLTYIPSSMFKTNSKLKYLSLHDNRLSYMPLNFYTELSNAGARLLVGFYIHNNPWHCACLLQLLADVKRVGGQCNYYGTAFFKGKWPECVYSGAHPCSRHAPSGLLSAPPRAQ